VSVTGRTGNGDGTIAGLPSRLAGIVRPSPVAYSVTTDAWRAGALGKFREPSWLRATTSPVPALRVKIPGADAATTSVAFPRDSPSKNTSTSVVATPVIA
jgi:hypothetical protein